MNKIFISIVLFFINGLVVAAPHFENCQIEEIVSAGDKNAHVRVDCAVTPRPACATASAWFGFDRSTESGKQYLALVMMAFSSNMKVSGYVVQNAGSCPAWQPNVALLHHVRIKKR